MILFFLLVVLTEYVVTLDSFRELLDGLESQQRQMEQLQPSSDVGVIQINIEKLKSGLLPSPVSCLREMNNMLPQVRNLYTVYSTASAALVLLNLNRRADACLFKKMFWVGNEKF